MAEVLLINPKRRRKRRRKMTAKQRMYFGKRRRRRSRVRAAAPVRRRRRRSRSRALALPRRRRRAVSMRRYRRRRRNPTLRGITGQLMSTAQAGLFGAAGGLVNDLAYGFVKARLPAQLQTGLGRSAAKLLSAVLVGMAANYAIRGRGREIAVGAATVVLHEALKERLIGMAPNLPLGEYDMGYMNPGAIIAENGGEVGAYLTEDAPTEESVGAYMDQGVGEYSEYE